MIRLLATFQTQDTHQSPVHFTKSFLAKLFADGGPLVFACEQFVPVFLGLFPRDEFVERGDVQDNAFELD